MCIIGRYPRNGRKVEEIIAVLLWPFVAVAVAVGIYCRRHTGTVDGFILGGRNVGPWMSALRLRHELLLGRGVCRLRGQFDFKYGISATAGQHRQRYHWLAARLVGP